MYHADFTLEPYHIFSCLQEHTYSSDRFVVLFRGHHDSEVYNVPIMHLEALLPTLPPELLWPEAARLAGIGRFAISGSDDAKVWSVECPLEPDDYDRIFLPGGPDPTLAGVLFEAGIQHAVLVHIGQAALCYRAALTAAESRKDVTDEALKALHEDVDYSIRLLESKYLAPYSKARDGTGVDKLVALAAANLPAMNRTAVLEHL
jgi:hypothetical protein